MNGRLTVERRRARHRTSRAAARAAARAARPRQLARPGPRSPAQSSRSWAFQCCSRLRTSAGLKWQYACSRQNVAMYCRKMSSGSAPTRSARRLPAALTRPESSAPRRARRSRRPSPPTTRRPRRTAGRRAASPPRTRARKESPGARAGRRPSAASRRLEAPGRIPSLRAGRYSRVPRVAITWSTACRIWHAPPIANVSTAATQSFSVVSSGSSGPMLLGAEPSEELVHVAEIAGDEEHEVETTVVEVREVEPGAEYALARVARVGDDGAADDADLDLGVEQREVDRDLGGRERLAVLGVQVAVVPDLDVRDRAAPLEVRAAEIGDAGRAELVEPRRLPPASAGASTRRDARRSAATRARTTGRGPARSRPPPSREGPALARRRLPRAWAQGPGTALPRHRRALRRAAPSADRRSARRRRRRCVRAGIARVGVERRLRSGRRASASFRSGRAGSGRAAPRRGRVYVARHSLEGGRRRLARPPRRRPPSAARCLGSSAQASARMNSAARSPIMIDGAFVFPVVTLGITDASATRRPSTPWTRSRGSTTAGGVGAQLARADLVVIGDRCLSNVVAHVVAEPGPGTALRLPKRRGRRQRRSAGTVRPPRRGCRSRPRTRGRSGRARPGRRRRPGQAERAAADAAARSRRAS